MSTEGGPRPPILSGQSYVSEHRLGLAAPLQPCTVGSLNRIWAISPLFHSVVSRLEGDQCDACDVVHTSSHRRHTGLPTAKAIPCLLGPSLPCTALWAPETQSSPGLLGGDHSRSSSWGALMPSKQQVFAGCQGTFELMRAKD